MNATKIIKDEGCLLDGLANPGNGYTVCAGTARYRIYQRLDGKWSFVGLNLWGRGYNSTEEAAAAARKAYGF